MIMTFGEIMKVLHHHQNQDLVIVAQDEKGRVMCLFPAPNQSIIGIRTASKTVWAVEPDAVPGDLRVLSFDHSKKKEGVLA